MTLILHCGATSATREEVDSIPTPNGTDTWTPIAHGEIADAVEQSLIGTGLAPKSVDYGLTKDGARLFGLYTLAGEHPDYALTVGFRNSHDKSFAASVCCGSRVFVCDNLAFAGEVTISSKHTKHLRSRLTRIVSEAVEKLTVKRQLVERRIALYKETEVASQAHLHDLVLRSFRADAIPAQAISKVIAEFEAPRHPEFRDWNLWNLQNAFTETLKGYGEIERRTIRLNGVLDTEIGDKLLAV
jgi:hypothetical protein